MLRPFSQRADAIAPGPFKSRALTGMMGLPEEVARLAETKESDQVPLGRRGTTDDLVSWVPMLGGGDSSWMTGEVVCVDAGWSLRRSGRTGKIS